MIRAIVPLFPLLLSFFCTDADGCPGPSPPYSLGSKSNILCKVESDAIWYPSVDVDNIEALDCVKKTSIEDTGQKIHPRYTNV